MKIFKQSRVLGHLEMQRTWMYLRDSHSRAARADQTQFLPVERRRRGKLKRRKRARLPSVGWAT